MDEHNKRFGLDYNDIPKLRSYFQRSGGRSYVGEKFKQFDFTQTDTPGWNYFKILFDFNSPFLDLSHNADSELNPPKITPGDDGKLTIQLRNEDGTSIDKTITRGKITAGEMDPTLVIKNTAYNYLLLNGEYERADLLTKFVQLLSDINTLSPWYFQGVDGLAEALAHPEYLSAEFKPVGDERKHFTIKCLPDAIDNRIGTLLDLYKSICFSRLTNRVIVPANLRKFDMSIYIFNTKIGYTRRAFNWETFKFEELHSGFHTDTTFEQDFKGNNSTDQTHINQLNEKDKNSLIYISSSKLLTFHNCEFDPDSNVTAYSSLSNADGWQNEYTIGVLYDNSYEQRYNEFIQRFIGDMIAWDINYNLQVEREREKYSDKNNSTALLESTNERLNLLKTSPDINSLKDVATSAWNNAKDTLKNGSLDYVSTMATSLALGNIFYYDWFKPADLMSKDYKSISTAVNTKTSKFMQNALEQAENAVSDAINLTGIQTAKDKVVNAVNSARDFVTNPVRKKYDRKLNENISENSSDFQSNNSQESQLNQNLFDSDKSNRRILREIRRANDEPTSSELGTNMHHK